MNNEFGDYYDCFNEEDKMRLARILMISRAESGLSQEKVALELGIAKKTVQNWERGISSPTLPQAIGWFRVMKIAAMPYLLEFLFPDMEGVSQNESNESLRKKLILLIEALPPEGIRQLLYLFYGDHGSSPRAVLNLMTAHLQTPLRDRYAHANMILCDYEMACSKKENVGKNHIQPNTDLLKSAIDESRKAIIEDNTSYILNSTYQQT